MRFLSITMSTGPTAGAPVPSMTVTPRRIRRGNGPSPSARGGALGTTSFAFLCVAGLAASGAAFPASLWPAWPARPPAVPAVRGRRAGRQGEAAGEKAGGEGHRPQARGDLAALCILL